MLGGLIRENKTQDSQGCLTFTTLRYWADFGSSGTNVRRTELVILMAPTVVNYQQDARG
ncbi:type II and III secretion system protein [Oceanisphaera profunda]|uniref:type II and III secretion system protein n=1 Tax=Oceanisphaera profunda TaxID=1416627 RepID=UPI0013747A9C|nr:type II and III secretion system protein [Oceanisphaera profunda]